MHQSTGYFHDLLLRHEIILPDASESISGIAITCTKDPSRAIKKLEHSLRLEHHRTENFLEGLTMYLQQDSNLSLAMSPIVIVDEEKQFSSPSFNAFFGQDDTFLKLILRLPTIQLKLMEFLIQRMIELSPESQTSAIDSSHPALRLLNHIRWCDVIYQPKNIVECLMSCVFALPRGLQIEVISSLPGLVSDKDQEALVQQLQDLTQSVQELIPCVMETITNLCLPPNSKALISMVSHSLLLLASAEAPLLPPIIRFLLDACNEENSCTILRNLRSSVADFLTSSHGATGTTLQNLRSTNSLLIGIIKFAVSNRPKFLEIFLKDLLQNDQENSISDETHVEVFDLWIIFSVVSNSKLRTKLNNILAKLFQRGRLMEIDIQKAVVSHGHALDILFPNILGLAQSCVSSNRIGSVSVHSHEIGLVLYQLLYEEFSSGVRRQEIIASLVAHVSSTLKQEVDSAFRILSNISKKETINRNSRKSSSAEHPTLRQFVAFLKTLLEDILRLSVEQQRMLFRLIFSCTVQYTPLDALFTSNTSFSRPETLFSAPDDVMILLKKFAASTNKKTQQVAIIGQVAYLCQISEECKMLRGDSALESHISSIFAKFAEQLRAIQSRKVLLTELAIVVASGELDYKPFLTWLHSYIADLYLDRFLGENISLTGVTPSKSGMYHKEIRCHSLCGLERHPCTVSIASNILNLEFVKDIRDCEMELLAPVVRLSALLLPNYSTCREDILLDFLNLLGTPFELPPKNALESAYDFNGRCRMYFWRSLRYAIDWTRETLSCFSDLYFVPNGLASLSSSEEIEQTQTKSIAVDNLIHEILTATSTSYSEALNMVNEAIASIVVDRLNQLLDIEIGLLDLSTEYPDSIDPLCNLPNMSTKSSSSSSKVTQSLTAVDGISSEVHQGKSKTKTFTSDDIKSHIKSHFRPLSPTVCSILGYGVNKVSFSSAAANMLFRTASPDTANTSFKSIPGSWTPVKIYLSHDTVFFLLNHTAHSVDFLEKRSNQVELEPIYDQIHQIFGVKSLSSFLEIFYKNRGFLAISRILMNIVNAVSGNAAPERDNLDCFSVETSDLDQIDLYLRPVITILHGVVKCKELRDEVVSCYKELLVSSDFEVAAPILLRILSHVSESYLSSGLSNEKEGSYNRLIPTCVQQDEAIPSLQVLCNEGVRSIVSILNSILRLIDEPQMLTTAINIVNVIGSITSLLEDIQAEVPRSVDLLTETSRAISNLFCETCDTLLRKNWIDSMNKVKYSQSDIGVLVFRSIKWHPLPFDRIHSLISNAITDLFTHLEEYDFAKKDIPTASTETYPTLSLQSFNFYYQPMFTYLTTCWEKIISSDVAKMLLSSKGNSKKSDRGSVIDISLDDGLVPDVALLNKMMNEMTSIIMNFYELIDLTRNNAMSSRNSILIVALREGRKFVDLFIKSEKTISALFSIDTPRVLNLISRLQKATRQLHSLCAHGKVLKNKLIANEVPGIRRSLETIIYQMKTIAGKHQLSDSFSIGTLKHRKIDGTEVRPEDEQYEEPEIANDEDAYCEVMSINKKKKNQAKSKKGQRQVKGSSKTKSKRAIDKDDEDISDGNESEDHDNQILENNDSSSSVSSEFGVKDDDDAVDLRHEMEDEFNEGANEEEDDLNSYGSIVANDDDDLDVSDHEQDIENSSNLDNDETGFYEEIDYSKKRIIVSDDDEEVDVPAATTFKSTSDAVAVARRKRYKK